MNIFYELYIYILDRMCREPDWDQGMEDSLLRRIQS